MKIFDLGTIDQEYLSAVGGKARGLNGLIKAGFNVPSGFVLVDIDLDKDAEEAFQYYLKSGLKKVAVRSSATSEDGVGFSYAGQYATVLNVDGEESYKAALHKCVHSLGDAVAESYSNQFGGKQVKMSVVVQQMIAPDCAGVCFTTDPSNTGHITVEAVEGLGEMLVSGHATATQYSIPEKETNQIENTAPPLTDSLLSQICSQALQMQKIFNMPLDTEWAVQGGILYWLQARPITVIDICKTDEFDPKEDLGGNVVTRCNIGEMLPEAITPLTWSVSLYAIDWGLREMLRIAGAVKKVDDLPAYSCAFSTQGHLFMNLSTIYRLTNAAFLTDTDNINFSICGRTLEEKSIIPGKKAWFFERFINTLKYLNFLLSRNKARKKLAAISDTFIIDNGQACASELFHAIDAAKGTAGHVALLHYITSAHSGAMSSALIQIMNKKFNDIGKCRAVLAELLQGIEGIESVDILASLRRVARAILEENPAASQYQTEDLERYLHTAGEKVKAECTEFFKRHGHRAIREAELRSKSWADDDKAFIEYLKTVIVGGAAESETNPVPDLKGIIKGYGFKGIKANGLVYLAGQSRDGVKNREYSKSKLIKVLDAFKKAYTHLARILVSEGKLPDDDLIFFLTHEEIGSLVKNENPALVKKALQRRRLLKSQSELRFSEIYTNKPEPLPVPVLEDATDILRGTPISRGIATGPARIVRNAQDAAKLQKGEIMVSVYTDIGWSPFYCLIEGLVTEIGSALSHGAVVAREYALPLVSNVAGATSFICTGDIITVDGSSGCIRLIRNSTKQSFS